MSTKGYQFDFYTCSFYFFKWWRLNCWCLVDLKLVKVLANDIKISKHKNKQDKAKASRG